MTTYAWKLQFKILLLVQYNWSKSIIQLIQL